LGYEVGELAPNVSTWESLLHPEDKDRAMQNLNRHFEDDTVRYEIELRLKAKTGEWRWIDARGKVFARDKDNKPLRMVGTHIDITERKRAEEERHALEGQLRQSQKLESIGTLAGGVAHEINNPVMGIMNYAQLILDRLGPDHEVAEFATEIGKETERVATIVKNLLSFARDDKESHSPARMCDIVESVLSLVRTVMLRDQITLDVDVPEDLPEIRCRSQQLRQVIMNLLTNARDALDQKYEEFDENKKVTIVARTLDRDGHPWMRITVEDHGSGISKEVPQRMFDPFYTTKPRDKGTGLGLSISHGIVKDHHGELSVESKLGEWTRFYVDLPVNNGWHIEEHGTETADG
jgi:PAS domain S-box-containing protein